MINHRTDVLFVIAALASILVGSGHIALADNINKNNTGIYLPTNTNQKQVCKTSGENSPISGSGPGSCTARSSDTIAESGGDTMAATQEGAAKTTIPPPPPPPTTHPTILTLTIFTNTDHLRPGAPIILTGILRDPITGLGISAVPITFTGTGIPSGINPVTATAGTYNSFPFPAPAPGTYTVQAHFLGEGIFRPSDSPIQTFTVRGF